MLHRLLWRAEDATCWVKEGPGTVTTTQIRKKIDVSDAPVSSEAKMKVRSFGKKKSERAVQRQTQLSDRKME